MRRPKKNDRLDYIQKMIVKLRTFLLSTDPVTSVNVDGVSVSLNRRDAREHLKELEQEERNILNPRRMMNRVDLRGAFG